MGLFKRDFNKPGPGVPKNAPKKKGVARYFEIVGRDSATLLKLNLMYVLCTLPATLLFAVGLFFFILGGLGWALILFVLALAASIFVGPAKTCMYNQLTRMLRDEPGFMWHHWKKCWKQNFKCTALPGMVYSLLVGSQVVAFLYYFLMGATTNVVLIVLYLFSLLLFNMAAPYFFIQSCYLELGTVGILKNSLLFALGYVPRSLAGMFLTVIFFAAQAVGVYLFPPAIIIPTLIGVTFFELIRTMWYWPQVDKTFDISKTLRERAAAEIDENLAEQGIDVSPKE